MAKIFCCVSCFDHGKSGISVYIVNVLRQLAEHHELTVAAFDADRPLLPESEHIRYRSIPTWLDRPLFNMLWHLFVLPLTIRQREFDAIFLPAANRRAMLFCRTFAVGVVHDLSQYHVKTKYDPFRMLYVMKLLPFAVRRLARVVAISESTAADLVKFWEIAPAKISVICNGYDREMFSAEPQPDDAARVEKYSGGEAFLLYMSRLEHPGKNHTGLIRAYGLLAPALKEKYRLVLGGSDWNGAEEIHRAAAASPDAARIRLAGFVASADLPALYRRCALYVFPSRFEGFGLSLVEAMACGAPTACSETSSLGEIGEGAARLFDPELPEEIAAALTAVLDDPEEVAALRRAGFRRAAEFSWEKHAAALGGLFERRRHRPGAVAVAVEYILALAGFCIVSVPGLLLGALCGKLRFRRVFDLAGRPLRLPEVRSESALWRGSPRFAYVLAGRIGLAGDPLRDFEPELACFDRPGVFTPDFIYRSGRLAVQGALRERKQMHRSLWSDLGLVLRTFPALLFGGAGREEEKFHLLGLEVRNRSMREALDHFKECIRERKRLQVAFMNPDCFNIACRDPEYFRLMKERFEVLADGIGLVIAGKLTGQRLRENINGSDMYPHLCEMAEKNGFSIYLLGARPGVAETMRRKTLESYPRLKFSGVRDGCFDLDAGAEQVVAAINASGADILLVAFGVPRQEKWLERWGEQLTVPVRIGVGGLFDFYSGRIRRAPLWMREIGMEWSFRLLMEPRRLFKRYIIGNPLFLWRVVRRQLSRR